MKTSGLFNGEGFVAGLDGADQTVSHGNRYLLFILLVGLAVRLMNVLTASAIEMDGISYALIAEAIARGAFGEAVKAVFPPFYPLFVAITHFFVGDWELAGRVVSLVFGLLIIYVSYRFFKRLLGERKALYGAFILAIHPYLARYSGQVLSESLATLLFTVTVFFFYRGWAEEKGTYVGMSGCFLGLTYLTRPEYLVYYAPFALLLVSRKRFFHTCLFFLMFVLLALAYIVYLRFETGFWMISGKMTRLPFVPLAVAVTNIPAVTYHLLAAIFPPFLLLLAMGFMRVDAHFRSMSVLLVVFHVLSLSLVSHSTRRYSVEFFPFLTLFVAEGIPVFLAFVGRFRYRLTVAFGIFLFFVCLPLTQAISVNEGRGLHKKAGLFLLREDPGSRIAARLPIESFYSTGSWTNLEDSCTSFQECNGLLESLNGQAIKYAVSDDRIAKECPRLEKCLRGFSCVADFSDSKGYVRVYRLKNE
ncbi:MAG: hypothetical protein A4E63_01626 [Syntrophorhabdus sp. PtaU1.Bin050]|nr:MAG: hypothetical protein A4E63_01626 [Syntrophorhabdus sp. PtaU1.Bin050]